MTQTERLLDIIGQAEDRFIEEAAPPMHRSANVPLWLRFGGMAACIALLAAVGASVVLPRLADAAVGHDGAAAEAAPKAEIDTEALKIEAESTTRYPYRGPTEDAAGTEEAICDCAKAEEEVAAEDIAPIENSAVTDIITEITSDQGDVWLDNRERAGHTVLLSECPLEWSWDDLTTAERYVSLSWGNGEYAARGTEISEIFIGSHRGNSYVTGYEYAEETLVHTAVCEVYDIRGIMGDRFLAVRLPDDGAYYLYADSTYAPPETLGEMIETYAASAYLPLTTFHTEDAKGNGSDRMALTEDDSNALWEMLSAYTDAPFSAGYHPSGVRTVFSVTSEVYGMKNRVFAVTEDGYVYTNAFDYAYAYFIGADAAQAMIAYADNAAAPAEDVEQHTLVGQVTDIQPAADGGYTMLVDDTVMMADPADGLMFTVDMSAPTLSRWLKNSIIGIGDLVVITYDGIVGDGYRINSASVVTPAILSEDPLVLIPE